MLSAAAPCDPRADRVRSGDAPHEPSGQAATVWSFHRQPCDLQETMTALNRMAVEL